MADKLLGIAICAGFAVLAGCDYEHTQYNMDVIDITTMANMEARGVKITDKTYVEDDAHVADITYVDDEHIIFAFHDGGKLRLIWKGCPLYDFSGRPDGKPLHYNCTQGSDRALDQDGHTWTVDGVHGGSR